MILQKNDFEKFVLQKITEVNCKNKINNNQVNMYLCSILVKNFNLVNFNQTLFDFYKKCREFESLENYLNLGEYAIYRSGMFPASLNKSLVGLPYYIDMGMIAYKQAQNLAINNENKKVFGLMNKNFKKYMECFSEITKESISLDPFSKVHQNLIIKN